MSGTTRVEVVQHYRTAKPNNPPPANELADGELCIEQADPCRLWVGVPTTIDATGRRLLYDRTIAMQGLLVEHDNSLAGDGTVALPLTVILVDGGQW